MRLTHNFRVRAFSVYDNHSACEVRADSGLSKRHFVLGLYVLLSDVLEGTFIVCALDSGTPLNPTVHDVPDGNPLSVKVAE